MAAFKKALIVSSWRCGSTVLNLSLIQHPKIFGWPTEKPFVPPYTTQPERWAGQPWVLYKNPQHSPRMAEILQLSQPPERVILLMRNPYAICHSYMEMGILPHDACKHINEYFAPVLEAERAVPELFSRARFESLVADPKTWLTDLLGKAFGLPFDEQCLRWPRTPVRWGQGDPKVSNTTGWLENPAEAWRARLYPDAKTFVRDRCRLLFEQFGYDATDTEPKT